MRVGNTTMKDPDTERLTPADVKPYTAPAEKFVPVYALASPPAQVGDCREAYPEAARSARIQGRIKLDVLVRADGSVGEVTPLNKLGYGLEETAVRALKRCRFRPGHDGTQPVATRITYTYTFTYEDSD
jgi:protein TonB